MMLRQHCRRPNRRDKGRVNRGGGGAGKDEAVSHDLFLLALLLNLAAADARNRCMQGSGASQTDVIARMHKERKGLLYYW